MCNWFNALFKTSTLAANCLIDPRIWHKFIDICRYCKYYRNFGRNKYPSCQIGVLETNFYEEDFFLEINS